MIVGWGKTFTGVYGKWRQDHCESKVLLNGMKPCLIDNFRSQLLR